MKIILASASPRRRELMTLITDDFEIRPSDIDETVPENIKAEKLSEYLSLKKASAVFDKGNKDEVVIGCDTVVVIDNQVLGKPADDVSCRKMLNMLSGKTHTVYTGVTILHGERSCSFTVETKVEFYNLTEKEISDYIATGEPFDKAGGYGIQGKGALLIKAINGDYFNVVGLPVSALKRKLEKFVKD